MYSFFERLQLMMKLTIRGDEAKNTWLSPRFKDYFNWTMTYLHASDIPIPWGFVTPTASESDLPRLAKLPPSNQIVR
jgi:hypothetical protein